MFASAKFLGIQHTMCCKNARERWEELGRLATSNSWYEAICPVGTVTGPLIKVLADLNFQALRLIKKSLEE